MLVGESETVTDATGAGGGAVIVRPAVPLLPSDVAMMATVPAASAVTTPVDDTDARVGAELDHVMLRPVSTLPFAS